MKVLDRSATINLAQTMRAHNSAFIEGSPWNRWHAMFFNPDNPTDARTIWQYRSTASTVAEVAKAVTKYNDGIFALTLPQGTGANERVGAEVQVTKDKWLFNFWIPNHQTATSEPLATDAPASGAAQTQSTDVTAHMAAANVAPRPVKIRMICVYQSQLLEPGNVGYMPVELFDDVNQRLSHFKRGDAAGYKVLYDKTRTIFPPNSNDSVTYGTVPPKVECTFAANFSYPRRYAMADDDTNNSNLKQGGNTVGTEITYDSTTLGTSLLGGTMKGQLLWYVFVEDKHAVGSTTISDAYHFPEKGLQCRIDRRTYWTDV